MKKPVITYIYPWRPARTNLSYGSHTSKRRYTWFDSALRWCHLCGGTNTENPLICSVRYISENILEAYQVWIFWDRHNEVQKAHYRSEMTHYMNRYRSKLHRHRWWIICHPYYSTSFSAPLRLMISYGVFATCRVIAEHGSRDLFTHVISRNCRISCK
jgi:hypothetical protein